MTWGTRQGNAEDMVYGEGRYGNTDRPASLMNLGEVVDFGKNVLIPATMGKIKDNQGNVVTGKATNAKGKIYRRKISPDLRKEYQQLLKVQQVVPAQ